MSYVDTKKFHIEEVFENIVSINKYQLIEVMEGVTDYLLYAKFYEILTTNEIKNLEKNGFVIEYIEPGKDSDGEAFIRIRFRATPQ